MNGALHPDADQLTAFAEQGLPAHEREQTLAHLAACPACRQIVFMAQQAETEQAPLPVPVVSRKPWYAGWNVLWPVAALAGLAMLAVHLRQPHANLAPQMAKVIVAPPTVSRDAPEAPKARNEAPFVIANVAPAAARPYDRMHLGAAPPIAHPVQVAPGRQVVLGSAAPAQSPSKPANIVVMDEAAMQANAPVPAPPPLPSVAQPALDAPQMAQAQRAAQQYHGSAPLPQAAQAVQAYSQSSASSMVIDGTTIASAERMLPSGLLLRSSVRDANRELAIDSAGTLFFSKDSGRSWKAVSRAWQGRVISVTSGAAPAAIGGMLQPSMRARVMTPAAKPSIAVSAGGGQAFAEVAGTVTDAAGAVIPGATVRASSGGQTVSDSSGHFLLAGLAAGICKVEVSAPGFMAESRKMTLAAGDRVTLGSVLQIRAATETVEVSADASAAVPATKKKISAEFQLTTDAGEVWISGDGQKWKRER